MHLLSKIIYSCKMLYNISGGLSVPHQELKTAYTATVYVEQLLQQLFDIYRFTRINNLR